MTINKNIAALIAQAAELDNQNERSAGFTFELPPAGITVARFVEYVEIGKHGRKSFAGKAKKDAEKVVLKFELLGPKNIKEIELEDKTKKTVTDNMMITLPKSDSSKSAFVALYEKMKYGRDEVKHMAQMLDHPFIVTVVHNIVDEGKTTQKTYANLRMAGENGEWTIQAPYLTDPLTGAKTNVPVPKAINPIKFFGWGNPTKETWDSLFIDGTREVSDDKGVKSEKSKNWLQTLILKATNFENSPLHQLLAGVDGYELPTEEPPEGDLADAVELDEVATVEDEPIAEEPEVAPEETVAATEVVDPKEAAIAALKAQLAALSAPADKAPAKAAAKPATPAAPKVAKPTAAKPAPAAKVAPGKAPAAPKAAAPKTPATPTKPAGGSVADALAALGLKA